MAFFCCGSFRDVKQPAPASSATTKRNFKSVPTSSIRGSLIRLYDCDIEETYYLDRDHELGKGGCGVVVIGEHKETQVQYAIKIVNKLSAERGRLDREIKLLKDVDHANIVRLFSVYESSAYMYFVMELCLGGHLGNLIARQPNKFLEEDWARRLCRQIISAVAHIHSRGIAHRDIKLQNILIDCTTDRIAQIKLIDFGYGSRFIGNLPMKTKCGTPYTTAPEVIRENYDERCDVWSVGVVLYIMLCGRRPFEALDIGGPLTDAGKAAMITNILAGRYHFNHRPWQSVSRQGINFVKQLLHQDYRTRLRSQEALEHPWLTADSTNKGGNQPNQSNQLLTAKSFRAISTLKKSQEHTHMQRTGMMAVVFGLQSRAAMDLRAVFQSMDTDSNGSISKKEFKLAMEKLAPELSEADIFKLFDLIDIDRNQQLSFTEFLIATLDPREIDIDELNNAFRVLDEDGNGFITKDELRKVIRYQLVQALENEHRNEQGELVKSINPVEVGNLYHEVEQRVEEIFRSVDINNDGKISRTEFLWAMTGSPEFLPRSDSRLTGYNNHNKSNRETREGSSEKPRRHHSMSTPVDPQFLAMSKRAASTSNLPVNHLPAPSTPPTSSSNRRNQQTPSPHTIINHNNTNNNSIDPYNRNSTDSPHTPPNFRGILARNQINSLDPTLQSSMTIAQQERSPRVEVKNGNIVHYSLPAEFHPIDQDQEEQEEFEQQEDLEMEDIQEHPEESTTSYNNKPVSRRSSKNNHYYYNNNTDSSIDNGSVKEYSNANVRRDTINELPDRDRIYRMSEVEVEEEEKSEFEQQQQNIPPPKLLPSLSFNNRNNNILTSNDSEYNNKSQHSGPAARTRVNSQASFKRDISAKFMDITTVDQDHPCVEGNVNNETSKGPALVKMGSKSFSVSSLLKVNNNN